MKYKFLDNITSDVAFEAYGKTLKELFTNAAKALLTVICKVKQIKPIESKEFKFKAENTEDLMMNWLQGIIAVIDTEEMFFSKIDIIEISPFMLQAKLSGEPIRPELGETVVKAVTYHEFKLEETKEGYKVRVSLDI